MSSKTVPISVRISHEDAEFLSGLTINGATTPSDKLRAIISDQRKRDSKPRDYQGCFQRVQAFMEPAMEAVRKAEHDQQSHSELITRSFEWLPDLIAYLASSIPDDTQGITLSDLIALEKGFADRVFRVMESVLQMGAASWCHCYDPQHMDKRSASALDLAGLIKELADRKKKQGE